jgi:CheY-like chemotaxis protein
MTEPVTGENRRLTVFLVDDHAMFRAGVRAELGAHVEVVGEASTVAEAVSRIAATLPDVVLLDVHMPDGGGRAVLDAMRRSHPQVKFLALSVSDAAEDVIGLIRAGARGYAGGGPRAGPADQPRARGAAAAGPGVRVQGDRQGALHLDQDGGDPRVERAPETADVQPVRTVPVGRGSATRLGPLGRPVGTICRIRR